MKSKKSNYKKKNYNQKQKTKNKKIIGGAEAAGLPSKKRPRENNIKYRKDLAASSSALNTALSTIIKKLSDAAVSYPVQESINEGDKLLNFYSLLWDRRIELKNFKQNFNKSIKAVGNKKIFSKNSNTNSLSKGFPGDKYPAYTDDFLINSLDFLHTNILELNELYSSLSKYELSFIEAETKQVFFKLIEEVLELVNLFDKFGNSERGYLPLNNASDNLLKTSKIKINQLLENQFISNFQKFRDDLREFRIIWSHQLPFTNSPNRGSTEEEMIKKVSELKKNILYLFKLSDVIKNGANLNLSDFEKNLVNRDYLDVFLELNNTNPKIPITLEQYSVAKGLINYVLMSYDISRDIELHPSYVFYRYDDKFKLKAPHLYMDEIYIKNIYHEYRVILYHIFNLYLNLIENNAYHFRDETIQLDSLRFDKFYEFLRNTTFNFADKKIFFKDRDIFIEKMFNLSKKILNIIYSDEEFSSFRDNNFVKIFLDKVEFTKKNEILDTLKTIYYSLLRRRKRPRLEIMSPQLPPSQVNGQQGQPALFLNL